MSVSASTLIPKIEQKVIQKDSQCLIDVLGDFVGILAPFGDPFWVHLNHLCHKNGKALLEERG